MTPQSQIPSGKLGAETPYDIEEGWTRVTSFRAPRSIARGKAGVVTRNQFEVLESIAEDAKTDVPPPTWTFNQPSVEHFKRIMDEMLWHHKKRWGRYALMATEGETPLLTESASALKRFLMIEWSSHRRELIQAGSDRWVQQSALWNRIALHRLRFLGTKRWYAVATTADEQRRRILVLAVPPREANARAKTAHASRQMTYNDSLEDLYEPGQRVSKALREMVSPRMREGLTRGFKISHRYHPERHHGRNYGGVKDMPEKAEAQLAKERGRFNEGPLLYTPRIVTDLNGIFYEDKNKFRLIWDCKRSSYNQSNMEAGGDFTTLQMMLQGQRPDAWMAGFDQRDAFRLWALEQIESDLIGMYSEATQSYDRARYLVFGANYSPEIQGENMKELMPIWDAHVNKTCPRGDRPDGFETTAAWVDDGHIVLDSSMTKEEADEQFQTFLDFCEKHGLEVAPEKNVWPTKVKEYVGLEIDSSNQTVCVGKNRVDKLVQYIDAALSGLEDKGDVTRHVSSDGKRSWTSTAPTGERLLDLCGGVGTGAHALLEAGWKVDAHWLVESHEKTRAMSDSYTQLLEENYPGRFRQDKDSRGALPHDVTKITEEHVKALGSITILTCAWPCQGFSGASRRGQGLRDARSGIFWSCLQVLKWVQKHNPRVRFLFENVDFSNSNDARLRHEFKEVSAQLGVQAVVTDAAHVSGAHRVRAYWASWSLTRDITQESGPSMQSLLDADHLAPICDNNDRFPQAPFNQRGKRRLKYVTIMKSKDTYSTRNGKALVYNKLRRRFELPRVEELERLVGLLEGATKGEGVSDDERRAACGNIIDRRMLSWLFRDMPTAAYEVEGRDGDSPFMSRKAKRVDWASLIGKLQFCAPVVHGGQAHLAASYASRDDFVHRHVGDQPIKQQWGKNVEIHISDAAIAEMRWWKKNLLEVPERRYYCTGARETTGFWEGATQSTVGELADKRVHATREGVTICRTDAAGKAGGGAWKGERFIHQFQKQDCAPIRSSNWRELATVVEAAEHWQKEWQGQRVLVMCDNSTACSIVRRQGSSTPELNALYERLRKVCNKRHIDLALRHIRGVDNVLADALSRYERGVDYSDWMFDRAEYDWTESQVGARHDVDACCDPVGSNKLASIFYSAVDDCVEYDWGGRNTWCNGDYNQLHRLLKHYKECRRRTPDRTGATFCVPVWSTKPWWRLLRGFEVVALYPAGEKLFTAPDWGRLRQTDGTFKFDSVRRHIRPTNWEVLTLRSPLRLCSAQGKSGIDAGARHHGRMSRGRGVHVLSGDASRDATILSEVRQIPLQRVHGSQVLAHRPNWAVYPMPHEGSHKTPGHQQARARQAVGGARAELGGHGAAEGDKDVATEGSGGPAQVRRPGRRGDVPARERESSSSLHHLERQHARTHPRRIDDKKLLPRSVGGTRIPARSFAPPEPAQPYADSQGSQTFVRGNERVQEAFQGEALLDHKGVQGHAEAWVRPRDAVRAPPSLGVVGPYVGRSAQERWGKIESTIPHRHGLAWREESGVVVDKLGKSVSGRPHQLHQGAGDQG